MNNKLIYILLVIVSAVFYSCEPESNAVYYSESVPVITRATVEEARIMYDDSITLHVELTDKMPLSTLEVKVIVNDIQLIKESIRTKGEAATVEKRYCIPFGPFMPDNAEVEVYLSSYNVEGFHTDMILRSTIVMRPEIPSLYLATRTGAVQFKLTDPKNLIYTADGLSFGNELAFLLPSKVTRFGRVDWTGLVFGGDSSELKFVEQGADSILLVDKTIIGFKTVTVDLFSLTVSGTGEKLVPLEVLDISTLANNELTSTNHLNESIKEVWKTSQLYLGKNTEMTFTGFSNIKESVSPDFFEVTGNNTAKFLGETGVYTVYYLPSANFIFVEQPAVVYPQALWLCGVGFGPPTTTYGKTSSWNWNTPLEYVYCRQISSGVYQATIYVNHEEVTGDEGWRSAFNCKFFHQRSWGGEIDAREYKISTPLLTAPTDADLGNFKGTSALVGGSGIYKFIINTNDKTVSFEKQ